MWQLIVFLLSATLANELEFDTRIAGGLPVKIDKVLYLMSVQYKGMHYCGGSLIAPDVVLTSAFCLEMTRQDYANINVRAAINTIYDEGQFAKVNEVCTHPKHKNLDYDITLFKLNRSINLGPTAAVVPLQPVGEEVQTRKKGLVAGWGIKAFGGDGSNILLATMVTKISDEECKSFYPEEDITPRLNCYGYKWGGRDSCNGDYGGAVVVDGKAVAVTFLGYACGRPLRPALYTKISDPDITNHINMCLEKFKNL